MKKIALSILIFNLMLQPIYSSTLLALKNETEEGQQIKNVESVEPVETLGKEEPEEPEEPVEQEKKENIVELKEKETSSVQLDYRVTLKTLGYYKNDNKDEEINNRNAILRFQSEHNLIVDGILGENSKEALNKRVYDKYFQFPDKINKPPTKGKWIAINKTKRILTLYEGSKVIKKYPIAQGKTPNLTPEGKFTIATKSVNPAWGGAGVAKPVKGGSPQNPLGSRWMGISFKGGSRYGIHGNNQPKSIGTNASMGCIRMINSDVEELYNLIPLKTIVWIGTEKKLEEWGIDQISYLKTTNSKTVD